MIGSLFFFEIRRQAWRTVLVCLAAAILVATAALTYGEELVRDLSILRARVPVLSSLLGLSGSATPALHLVSLCYGFLLPLIWLALLVPLGTGLVAGRVGSGEMVDLLASPHGRAAVVTTQYAVLVFVGFCLALSAFVSAAATWFFLGYETLNLASLVRLNTAFFLMALMTTGIVFLLSCVFNTRAGAVKASLLLMAVLWALGAASQTWEMLRWMKYISPFSLYDPRGSAMGEVEALRRWLWISAVAAGAAAAGARRFSRRDLPL